MKPSIGTKCREAQRAAVTKHSHTLGKKASPTYTVWASMIQRCTNPKHRAFPYYGGRGITVCDRWREFANFLADMGERPDGMTLERENNNAGYEPGNCRWATRRDQQNNRRACHTIEHDGLRLTLTEWARRYGIAPTTLGKRLASGVPIGDALSKTPDQRFSTAVHGGRRQHA